jgi:hypothetical protein
LIRSVAQARRSSGVSRAAGGIACLAAATTASVCPIVSSCNIFTLSLPTSIPIG